jgi:DNA-binding XRE family transcriptional regulator
MNAFEGQPGGRSHGSKFNKSHTGENGDRDWHSLTQTNMAQILGVNQSAISKIEKRTDMYLSTLRSYVEAMGGSLEIHAVFPEGAVRVDILSDK